MTTAALADMDEIRSDVAEGSVRLDLLGKDPLRIALAQMERVEAPKGRNLLRVQYKKDEATQSAVVHFGDRKNRDEAFQTMKNELGGAYRQFTQRNNPLRSLLAPVLLALLVIVLAFGCSTLASNASVWLGQPGMPTYSDTVISIIDIAPLLVMVIGGLLLLGALIWMLMVITRPGALTVLTRRNDIAKGRRRVSKAV